MVELAKADVQQLAELLQGVFVKTEELRKFQDELAHAFLLIEESQQGEAKNAKRLQAVEQRVHKLETQLEDVRETMKEAANERPNERSESDSKTGQEAMLAGGEKLKLRERINELEKQRNQEKAVLEEVVILLNTLQERIPNRAPNLERIEAICARVPKLEAKLRELLELEQEHLTKLRSLTQPAASPDRSHSA